LTPTIHALHWSSPGVSGHVSLRRHSAGHIGDTPLRDTRCGYSLLGNGSLLALLGLLGGERLLHPGAALKFGQHQKRRNSPGGLLHFLDQLVLGKVLNPLLQLEHVHYCIPL
jgi:hypothetical protein